MTLLDGPKTELWKQTKEDNAALNSFKNALRQIPNEQL